MPEQLVVLLGAGASYDCTRAHPKKENWRPPLVTELFEARPAFTPILAQYPDAQTLAPDLRVAVESGSPGLEDYLREQVLHSKSSYDRRRFLSIPLYLQHLLFEVSQYFTDHPVNYDRLINACLRAANETLFVTLNYDTLLDDRLSRHARIGTLAEYVDAAPEWSLFKVHGSVNWVRTIESHVPRGGTYVRRVMEAADLVLGEQIVMRSAGGVEALRTEKTVRFYPALSVPLGAEDEFNCPDYHLDRLRERLTATDGLHVLTVGYSGWDSNLLQLLRDSGNTLRSLKVVNHDGTSALEAASRIAAAFSQAATPDMAFLSDFNAFAHSPEIDKYLGSLS